MRSPLTEKYLPKILNPEELDDFLARGWFRSGAKLFTSQYIYFNNTLFSPIWIRVPLKKMAHRKSVRKILKRNKDKYRVEFNPLSITHEKNELYSKYRQNFHSSLSVSLVSNLQDTARKTAFNTWECCIYDDDKLVAASFFDLGKKSIMSLLGIYDHDYKKDTLGLYTMLMEMEYGVENGFEFYYPGYIIPYYDRFDYKLRISQPQNIEFLEPGQQTWLSFEQYNQTETPTAKAIKKLSSLAQSESLSHFYCNLISIPCFDKYYVDKFNLHAFKSPVLLTVKIKTTRHAQVAVYYDYHNDTYEAYTAGPPAIHETASTSHTSYATNPSNVMDITYYMREQHFLFDGKDSYDLAEKIYEYLLSPQ